MAVSHLRMHFEYLKIAVSTALEYKVNFIIQVASMILNDIVWIIFWMIFFGKFNTVSGWQIHDLLLLYALTSASYGISGVLFGNRSNIAEMITEGKLDFYLTLPKSPLYHLLVSRSNWYDLGDVFFGLTIALFALPASRLPLFALLLVTGTTIFVSLAIILGSLAFFIGSAESIGKNVYMGTLSFSLYPMSIFKGFTKFILLTVIPAGFIAGVPVELLRSFDIRWLLCTLGFTACIFLFSIGFFYFGLRRYESGNLLHVRI